MSKKNPKTTDFHAWIKADTYDYILAVAQREDISMAKAIDRIAKEHKMLRSSPRVIQELASSGRIN